MVSYGKLVDPFGSLKRTLRYCLERPGRCETVHTTAFDHIVIMQYDAGTNTVQLWCTDCCAGYPRIPVQPDDMTVSTSLVSALLVLCCSSYDAVCRTACATYAPCLTGDFVLADNGIALYDVRKGIPYMCGDRGWDVYVERAEELTGTVGDPVSGYTFLVPGPWVLSGPEDGAS